MENPGGDGESEDVTILVQKKEHIPPCGTFSGLNLKTMRKES